MARTEPQVIHFRHPGAGRGTASVSPRGRQVEPEALDEVRALLDEGPRRRDLLIEYLHRIQDHYRCLNVRHLAALAQEMDLAQSEVFEVASFYSHFDIVGADEPQPAPITLRVCDSLSCEMAGSGALFEQLSQASSGQARVLRAPCMGYCHRAPVVAVGRRQIPRAAAEAVMRAVAAGETEPEIPFYKSLDAYLDEGGYDLLGRCLAGHQDLDQVIRALESSGLRGLGGAGFPPGEKWKLVRAEPGPRYMAVNADEGEPGTFKDRYHLERDPHRVLEGMLIGAWAVEAEAAYIYLRDEYPAIHQLLQTEIAALEDRGLVPHTRIELRRGAGAYICGEESAMIESIEGKRGLPRHRPPYVSRAGIFGRPTLVNNVETLYWVRDILERGPEWFGQQGRGDARGLRSFSVSGRVMDPGLKLAPAGISARALIDQYCGGMADGHALLAYLPGGASGGILPARLADLPLDFGSLEPHGGFVGSHAVIVLSDQDDLRRVVLNLMRFFEDESCGQCTPCRVGTRKAVAMMEKDNWDRGLLEELSRTMADASICGLGQAAPNPLLCALRYFPEVFP
ncbi:MAG: NADH-ubiquinone oxidoreductase-F iron-sulfur binding region domain-containing protein [Gammaproteobacteria bacterium]